MLACVRRSCRLLLYLEAGEGGATAPDCCYLGPSSHGNVYFSLSLRILKGTGFALEFRATVMTRPYLHCTRQASQGTSKVPYFAIHYHVVRVQRASGSDWGVFAACFTGDTRH